MESVFPDWTQLPQDLLTAIFGELEIPDLLRSGAVCTSWHSAYSTFRRLRLPSPKQSPYLLYASDACGPDAAAIYCPSTGATFRVPMPEPTPRLRSLSPIGSGHGWLVVADEVSNLHLMNPLTGGHAALPPITTMQSVECSLDDQGNLVYTFSGQPEHPPFSVPAAEARHIMYERAVLSCSLSAGGACVVLLTHMHFRELSFARVGVDECWTWISPGDRTGLSWRDFYCDAAYNTADGLFYVVRADDSMYTLDLNGPSLVATKIMPELKIYDERYRYLIRTPWGDLLQAWRFRDYLDPLTYSEGKGADDPDFADPLVELNTTDLRLYKVDVHEQRLVEVDSVGDHALFLGYNGSMCLPVKDFPGLMPNCAYITDDSFEYINFYKCNKREIGAWSIQNRTLHSLGGASPLKDPMLNWPAPIWITPSLPFLGNGNVTCYLIARLVVRKHYSVMDLCNDPSWLSGPRFPTPMGWRFRDYRDRLVVFCMLLNELLFLDLLLMY